MYLRWRVERMTNILCIGASTYNIGTPEKIMDALIKTNFLQNWAVIITIHKYLPLCPAQNLQKQKTHIINGFYKNGAVILIDSVNKYQLEKGKIYVLPESLWCCPPETGIWTEISACNGSVSIYASNSIDICTEEMAAMNNLVDKEGGGYLPSINRVMCQLIDKSTNKVAGLILAGKGTDGSEGLLNIKNHGGVTAVQNPCECYREGTTGTDSMPRNALQLASNHGFNHEIISLGNTEGIKNLADWLVEIK